MESVEKGMETILVHWDKPHPWTIYYESKPDKAQGREVSVGLKLIPGVQTVSMNEWTKVKEHKRVKAALEEGTLKVEMAQRKAGGDAQPLPDVPKTLKGMSPKDAKHFVTGIMDEALLKKYRSTEERKDVKKAINDQLAKLKAAVGEE